MRWTSALALFLALMLAACGGGSGSNGDGDADGDATPTAAETDGGDGDGDGDGNGGSSGDLDELAEDLTPPNSTETSRTTAGGFIFLTFTSTDSPDDLQSFYEQAIEDTGLEVLSTTTAGGTYSWIFGETDGVNGVVSVSAGPDGTGSQVGIQVGTGD